MPALIDRAWRLPRSEALPRHDARRRAVWSAGADGRDDEEAVPGESYASPADRPRYLPRVLKGVRALVVDDDPDNVELFSTALTVCGAVVVTATSADDALSLLSTRRVDVVVSDIAMPGGDGYWLIREVRRLPDPRFSGIPLVAVTAFGREHSRARVLAAGFAEHLQKPIDPEDLCRAVAKAMGR